MRTPDGVRSWCWSRSRGHLRRRGRIRKWLLMRHLLRRERNRILRAYRLQITIWACRRTVHRQVRIRSCWVGGRRCCIGILSSGEAFSHVAVEMVSRIMAAVLTAERIGLVWADIVRAVASSHTALTTVDTLCVFSHVTETDERTLQQTNNTQEESKNKRKMEQSLTPRNRT